MDENAAYVRSVIRETVRNAAGQIPVYGFHWNCEYNIILLYMYPTSQSIGLWVDGGQLVLLVTLP